MILAQLGSGLVLAALVLGSFAALVSAPAARWQDARLAAVGRRALYATAIVTAAAAATLVVAFIERDFALAYVAQHIDSRTPLPLAISGLYSGQEGSLLYWTLALSVIGSLAVATAPATAARGYSAALVAGLVSFLLVVLVFVASPFASLAPSPPDGLGLNPLLRDQGMLIHPPFLLAGYSSFAVPACLAAGSLLAGRLDRAWLLQMRRFALLSWTLQAVGLTLGMWWAYHVLGWGGYWGWDPVENVALLPWLVMTAYIHSVQAEERVGTFRSWNLGLLLLAGCLSLFGTFVVRSGVIQSVHSFAVSALGPWFLALLAVAAIGSLILYAWRSRLIAVSGPAPALVSRESAFLLNNLLLLALVVAILWGTLLPLASELSTGAQAVVGAAFYDRVTGPLVLLLLALMAVGPLIPWRPSGSWTGQLKLPALAAAGSGVGMLVAGVRQWSALAAAAVLAGAVVGTLLAALRTRRFNRRRHGAYLAHLGLLLIAVGVAGSQLGQRHLEVTLEPGQQLSVAGYQLAYTGAGRALLPDAVQTTAHLRLGDEPLDAQRTVYSTFGGQSASGVAIHSTPAADLYVVLVGVAADGSATFSVFLNPLVTWIWSGAALLVLGVVAGNLPALRLAWPWPALVARRAITGVQ